MELLEELEDHPWEDLLHFLAREACQGLARKRIASTVSAPGMARPDSGVLLEEVETRTPGLLMDKLPGFDGMNV